MKRVTIQMIAEQSGVSRGTVDRVLHGRPNVQRDIRDRVLEAVRKLGYTGVANGTYEKANRIGILLPGNSWFNADLKREWMTGVLDAKKVVEPLGFEVLLIECESDLPDEFVEQTRKLMVDGLDGLAISAKNNPVVRELINNLAAERMPVVTYNSDIPDCSRKCFIGQNLYKSGEIAADLISKFVERKEEILVVAGNLEIDAHTQRVNGFNDKCAKAGIEKERLHLVESFNEYGLTYDKVSKALCGKKNIRAVYMANESVPACAEAIRRSGRNEKIMVVGNDLSAITKRLLTEGLVDFIIEQNVYLQGYQSVIMLKELILCPRKKMEQFYFTSTSIINCENMK